MNDMIQPWDVSWEPAKYSRKMDIKILTTFKLTSMRRRCRKLLLQHREIRWNY